MCLYIFMITTSKAKINYLVPKYNVQAWHIIKMIIWSTQVIRYSRTIKYLIKIFFMKQWCFPKNYAFFLMLTFCASSERERVAAYPPVSTNCIAYTQFFFWIRNEAYMNVSTYLHTYISSYFAWGRSVKFSGTWKSKAHTKF